MKSFELGEYMKPMISKAGIIASRKNEFFLKAVKKMMNPKTVPDPLPDFKPRIAKMKKKKPKSSKSATGSYSFKAISRKEPDNSESPPPNRYKPSYSFIHKKPPATVFGKERIRDLFGKIEDYSSFQHNDSIDSPRRLPGITFDKQLDRKTGAEGNVSESRYESVVSNSLLNTHKVHSFEAYTPRKTFFRIHEFQPEYEAKQGFMFRGFKARKG